MQDKLIEWSDDLSIGIPEIDEQHKVLVELLNNLHSAIVHRKAKDEIGETLDHLIEYTRVHFATEESVMNLFKYPEFEEHRKEHQKLIDEVADLKQRYDAGTQNLTMELLHFLKTWLQNHIIYSDKKAGDFIVKNQEIKKSHWWNKFFHDLFKKP